MDIGNEQQSASGVNKDFVAGLKGCNKAGSGNL